MTGFESHYSLAISLHGSPWNQGSMSVQTLFGTLYSHVMLIHWLFDKMAFMTFARVIGTSQKLLITWGQSPNIWLGSAHTIESMWSREDEKDTENSRTRCGTQHTLNTNGGQEKLDDSRRGTPRHLPPTHEAEGTFEKLAARIQHFRTPRQHCMIDETTKALR